MVRVDIQYNKDTNRVNLIVIHKRLTKVIGSFENSKECLESAKFLTKVFSDITLDTMNECHEKAIKAIRSLSNGTNSISK